MNDQPPSLGCARCGDCCDPVVLTPENAAVLTDPPPTADRYNLDFAAEHWHPRGQRPDGHLEYTCDQFDPDTRLCRAGDARPPVCAHYPWYGAGPTPHRAADLYPRCSYLLDVPAADRPQGARPLIPIEVIRR
jgi:Fe-S-cluster containining protein